MVCICGAFFPCLECRGDLVLSFGCKGDHYPRPVAAAVYLALDQPAEGLQGRAGSGVSVEITRRDQVPQEHMDRAGHHGRAFAGCVVQLVVGAIDARWTGGREVEEPEHYRCDWWVSLLVLSSAGCPLTCPYSSWRYLLDSFPAVGDVEESCSHSTLDAETV